MGDFNYCPLCNNPNFHAILNLGDMPLVNSINDSVSKYPLNIYQCRECGLVFANMPKTPDDIFSNYTYFSSWSKTWLSHCTDLFLELTEGSFINKDSFILEIASNDGYMLRNFTKSGYFNVLGVEPAGNIAALAVENGIPTVNDFFTETLAVKLSKKRKADCIIALNVLAHVPDISGFLKGIGIMLKKDGIAIFEFHHLMSLIAGKQFDTIYHEHFSYLSLHTVENTLLNLGMRVFRAEKIPSQGGSLRIYVSHNIGSAVKKYPMQETVELLRNEESGSWILPDDDITEFSDSIKANIASAKKMLLEISKSGKTLSGYGAAAKAVVFINALGLDKSHISCVADINPVKQGKTIPGTSIPIVSPSELTSAAPDYVIIFPWNLKNEIASDLRKNLPGKTRYIVFTPEAEIFT